MAELLFDKDLTVVLDDPVDCEHVEDVLAHVLLDRGLVRDSYPQAIAEREKSFPTGLDAGGVNVAMPHCDIEHVKTGALAVGVLKRSVAWHRMDDPEATCDVSLVVMLALNEAHAHLEMLQKVVALIQDQELMGRIVSSSSPDEAYELVSEKLA